METPAESVAPARSRGRRTASAAGPGGASGAGLGGGRRTGSGAGRAGAVGLVCAGAFSLQFGSAVAALLFPRAGALGVVGLRLVFSALIMLVLCRPRLRGHSRGDWAAAVGLGIALGTMNTLFYQAIDRIPLGPAVTLELLGPLALSVVAARRALSLLWAALALGGVYLLGSSGFDKLNAAGVAFALAAGGMWVLYILFNARAGARFPKMDGLALAMGVAAVISAPLAVTSAGTALLDPVTLGLGAAVAVLSSGLPYAMDLLALRRLPQATFAVLMSLMPAAAATAGFLVLGQSLGPLEVLALVMVIAAAVGAVRTGARRPSAAPERRPGS
ncbi:EamA family transporter [Streptomyces sp. N2-109]|uniref:EamA family transporter n=1 Tax=Streptomyces gossypii TaxID=2883101 RepID=A0ABT2JWK3_9ACTN|nr:EamA family transporter [Streptomyces gossypii]MCT2591829.1 EamA family transporter [Streptomyces gossypii]